MGRHKEILIRRPTIKTVSLQKRAKSLFCLRASKAPLPPSPAPSYGARKATRGVGVCTDAPRRDSSKVSKEMESESRWEYFLFSTSSQEANHYFVNDDSLKGKNCAFRILNGRKRLAHVICFSVRMRKSSQDCLSDAQYKPKS